MGTMASVMTKSALTIFRPPVSTQKPNLRERIGLVQLGSRTQLLAGAGDGTLMIRPTELSPVQNQDASARRNGCWAGKKSWCPVWGEHNVDGEARYIQRNSAKLWVVLRSLHSCGPAASLTSLGLCLASPGALCAVSRPVLFPIHLEVIPSLPHHTHTLPPVQCAAGPFREIVGGGRERRRRAWRATTPQKKRDKRPSHHGSESPLPYYWSTCPKDFRLKSVFVWPSAKVFLRYTPTPHPPVQHHTNHNILWFL